MLNRRFKMTLAAILSLGALGAQAQQMMAQIISVEPLARQEAQSQWVCPSARGQAEAPGAGYAVGGAAAGALAGSLVGKGRGRAVSIAAGAMVGAMAGEGYAGRRGEVEGQECGYVRAERWVPTGAYKALVDVDGVAYEWVTRRAVSPGDLAPVDMRWLRPAL